MFHDCEASLSGFDLKLIQEFADNSQTQIYKVKIPYSCITC